MNDKKQILVMLDEEFKRWEGLLGSMNEQQLTAGQLPEGWSIKDIMAHLMTWQQRSIARLEAAVQDREPVFPKWADYLDLNSDSDDDLNKINAWIYETNRERAWQSVYRDWRAGYLRFMELGQAIPEVDLMTVGRYTGLEEYPLSIILVSSYEHHHDEHLVPLLAWLKQHGDIMTDG